MRPILSTYQDILQFRTETFVAIKQSEDGFWYALKLFVVVSLIAGFGQWLGVGTVLHQPTLPEQIHRVAQVIERVERNLPEWLPQKLSERLSTFAQEVVGFVAKVEEATASLMPPLGARPSRVVTLLGNWLGTPFQLMANYLGFALVIFLVVKLMGGTGTLSQHLSLMALAIAPYVLAFFDYIPAGSVFMDLALGIFGRTLILLAVIWALAILVKALAIAHDIELKRAAVALVSAFGVLYVLVPVAISIATGYILFG
jgi:hypothetical protein